MPFTGWPPTAIEWFEGLEADNSRTWFAANRRTYDEAVRGPLEALLDEVGGEFGDGKVFRPNRDTRFSKDKSPYKLQIYAVVGRAGGGSWYVQLRKEGLYVGGGLYMPDPALLARVRGAIADERTGRELVAIVDRLEASGLSLISDGGVKTAPRGYAVDHPRIRLLRLRHLAAGTLHPPGRWLSTAAAKKRVVEGWRAVTPLLEWTSKISSIPG